MIAAGIAAPVLSATVPSIVAPVFEAWAFTVDWPIRKRNAAMKAIAQTEAEFLNMRIDLFLSWKQREKLGSIQTYFGEVRTNSRASEFMEKWRGLNAERSERRTNRNGEHE